MSQAKKHDLTGDNGEENTDSYPSKKHAAETPSKRQDFFDYFQRLPMSSPSIFIFSLLIRPEHAKMLQEELPDLQAEKLDETLRELGDNNSFLETLAPHLRCRDYAEALDAVKLKIREFNFPTIIPPSLQPTPTLEPSDSIMKPPRPHLGGESLRDRRNDRISTALYHLYNLIWVQERTVFQTEPKNILKLKPLPLAFDFSASSEPQLDLVDDNSHLYVATYMVIPDGSPAQFPSHPELSRKILVRSGYEDMQTKIEGSGDSSVVVLGQPGIGKTYFLSYLLVKRFQQKKRTFLQLNPTFVYCFTERGAFRYDAIDPRLAEDYAEGEDLWYLVDCNSSLPTLPVSASNLLEALGSGVTKIIQTTSPEEKHYKDWTKIYNPLTLWMDVCTWEDISLMSLLKKVGPDSPNIPPTLPFYYRKFGRSARICLRSTEKRSFANKHNRTIIDAISKLPPNNITSWFPSQEQITSGGSHTLYMVRPEAGDSQSPRIGLASLYIRQKMTLAADRVGRGFLLTFYRTLRGHQSFGGSAGRIFEVLALHLIGQTDRIYKLRSLEKTNAPLTELAVKAATEKTDFSTTNALKTLARAHPDELLTPTSPNFATIDGIIVDSKGTPWLIQTTISSKHGIKAVGLDQVLTSLTSPEFNSTQIKQSRKIWKFVFVVPQEVEASFRLQNVTGEAKADGAETAVGDKKQNVTKKAKAAGAKTAVENKKLPWSDVIEQYVLGVDIDSFQQDV